MHYFMHYASPLGIMSLVCHGAGLTVLKFERHRFHDKATEGCEQGSWDMPPFGAARQWLDAYFAGKKPGMDGLPLAPEGSAFRLEVWDILRQIPYGQCVSYGDIAQKMAARMGRTCMSARAVGGAVGHNPLSVIIPCHRVVGANGSLTGYGGGMENKVRLLTHEGVDMTRYRIPTKGTAL